VGLKNLEQNFNQAYYCFDTVYFTVRSNYIISFNSCNDINNGCIRF